MESRWYFSYAINYRSYNVYQTTQEYTNTNGYATKEEAISAAINHLDEMVNKAANTIEFESRRLMDLTEQRKKLVEEKSGRKSDGL